MNPIWIPIILISGMAHAQAASSIPEMGSESEVSCRVEAKEAALLAYQGCINGDPSAEIYQDQEDLEKNYQARLHAQKEKYEAEIAQLKSALAATQAVQTAKTSCLPIKPDKKPLKPTVSPKTVSKTTKRQTPSRKTTKSKPVTVEAAQEVTEMIVELRPAGANRGALPDQSEMDLPEPIPF